jgi:predicted nucleotidyltransferase
VDWKGSGSGLLAAHDCEFEAQAADSFSSFLDLKESLEALFQRSVDLVELRAIRNRRLRHYIEQSKSSIYPAA